MANAAPTYVEVWAMIRQAVKIISILYQNAVDGGLYSTVGNNLTGQVDTLTQLIEGVYAGDADVAARDMLGDYSDVLRDKGRDMLDPLIFELGRIINSSADDVETILDDLYTYMADLGTPDTVLNRVMSPGAVTPDAANIGDGTIVRHTADRYGYEIENASEGVLTFECTEDGRSGAVRHQEVWNISGESPSPNGLQTPEHAGDTDVTTQGPDLSILDNPSFEDDATFVAPGPTSWPTDSAGVANITRETTVVYIGSVAVKFTATEGMNQTVTQSFSAEVPYCLAVFWNRNGSSGTLTAKLGSQSVNVVVAAQSGWQVLTYTGWYKEFQEAVLDVEIEWAQTTTDLVVDSIILVPMDPVEVDGSFFTVLPSSDSVEGYFSDNDKFTFTDNHTDTGVIQFIIYLLYLKYLPHDTTGNETIADPSF